MLPLLAGLAALASLPAHAEVFFRPFGGVYVERYYEPPPPPVYYPPPPAYGAPARFPYADIGPMLRSMGMSALGTPRVDGPTYVVDATARSGARMRVRIDSYSGRVIAMHPIGPAPATPYAGSAAPRVPNARQAFPAQPPLPPARPPELAAVPAPAPSAEQPAAPAQEEAPSPTSAAAADASSDAAPAKPESAPGAVRIIPGTAVPPSAAAAAAPPPAEPPPSSGTGTGVGTGSDTPAGTASVFARGADGKAPPPADE